MSDLVKYIVYDNECPFCSAYVRMMRLRDAIGPVELVDARSGHEIVHKLRLLGYDLDEGMAYVDGDDISYGDECVHKLALMSTSSGLFNWVNALIFSNQTTSRLLYPILRLGRTVTLRLLGRRKMKDTAASI